MEGDGGDQQSPLGFIVSLLDILGHIL